MSAKTEARGQGPDASEKKEGRNSALMRQAGSTTGRYDPESPDQWRYVLENGAPAERALAWVKSKSIAGSRSPYCVGENRKPLYIGSLAADLGMAHQTAKNLIATLVKQGRVRLDEQKKRIWYRADVPVAQPENEIKNAGPLKFVQSTWPPYVVEFIRGLPESDQLEFESRTKAFCDWREDRFAELMGSWRGIVERVEDSMLQSWGTAKKRLRPDGKNRRAVRREADTPQIELALVAVPEFVQSTTRELIEFVQNGKNGSHKPESAMVQTGVSLLPSDTDTDKAVSRSGVETTVQEQVRAPRDLPTLEKVRAARESELELITKTLVDQLGDRLHDTPPVKLIRQIHAALHGAPPENLFLRVQQRRGAIRSYWMCLNIAVDVRKAWQAAERKRQQAELPTFGFRTYQDACDAARRVLCDEMATQEEQQHAREILGTQSKTATKGST